MHEVPGLNSLNVLKRSLLLLVLIYSSFSVENVLSIESIQFANQQHDHPTINTVVIYQEINNSTNNTVNNTVEYIYVFQLDHSFNRSTSDVRVHVTTEKEQNLNYPVLFVVRQQKDVISWQLPQRSKIDSRVKYSKASRTLCSEIQVEDGLSSDVDDIITVTVSTSSSTNVNFSIRVTVENNFVVRLGEPDIITHVSPPSPRFYRFLFPTNISVAQYVLLEVKSNDSVCMTVSVQNATCPVFDEESNVQFSGYWQTMTTQAGMTIRSEDFPNGFYVVFVVHTDDSRCTKYTNGDITYELFENEQISERRKVIKFSINEKINSIEYVVATFGTIAFFLLYYVLSVVIFCIYNCRVKPSEFPIQDTIPNGDTEPIIVQQHQVINEIPPVTISSSRLDPASRNRESYVAHPGASVPRRLHRDSDSIVDSTLNRDHWLANSSDSSLDETDIDFMQDVNRYKDVFRTSRGLCVSALARKNPRILAKKSQLYLWTLFTVAIFYALPVVQLVFTYQKVLHTTGNQDLCYYNYLCSHPLWLLSDFNHVYSNIGYIMLGTLFVILVYRRDRMHQKLEQQLEFTEPQCGIPRHYGLFYTMGAALIMEGILSASYHVCPNGSNFQFDTSFMYIIAQMCVLKIYQTRHPDINSSAYVAFASLAVVILISVIGVMASSVYFWGCFTALHLGFCLFLTLQIYYLGRWRLDCGLFSRIYMTWRNDCLASPLTCLRPMYIDRFILLMLANFVNWGVAAFGLLKMSPDFATHLLFIFMSNLFLYTIFYILMKLTHREKIVFQPAMYILLSTIFWSLAMFVFLHKSTSWQLTPAESRTFNRECFILRFYDTHDLWHFLSASAMFFSFMMYLTLDDDLVSTPRNRIPVF